MARAYFRDERSRFVILFSGVELPEEPPLTEGIKTAESLAAVTRPVLSKWPNARLGISWSRWQARLVPVEAVDFAFARFSTDGRLEELVPFLQQGPGFKSCTVGESEHVAASIICAYNDTSDIPDRRRPAALRRHLLRHLQQRRRTDPEAVRLAVRILSASWLAPDNSVTETAGNARLRAAPPDFMTHRHAGFGGFMILWRRVNPLRPIYDLWFSCSHLNWDGAPFLDFLAELGASVPRPDPLHLDPELLAPESQARLPASTDSAQPGELLHTFVDFAPFLRRRQELSQEVGIPISIPALLLWGLAREPVFSGRKFLLPVDLPATEGRERTMGIMFIRPTKHIAAGQREPFASFLAEYETSLAALRRRSGPYYTFTEAISILPAPTYSVTLRLLPRGLEACFGSTGITILRQAEAALVTGDDFHGDGYVGFGSMNIPVRGGGRACSVSVRAPSARARAMMNAVRRVAQGHNLP
ncbi:MAG: hypothetical protein Kow00129_12140 [Thermoleophilia bacterium]